MTGRGNDYDFIDRARDRFVEARKGYHIPISIVIPVYNRSTALDKTLATLTHQTYPRHLMEVVIADDGSSDSPDKVAERYQFHLNIVCVRQVNLGYRLSRVRNLAIRAARHKHIVLLDGDIMPVPALVESYAQYFHVTDRAVLLGLRRFVDATGIAAHSIIRSIDEVLRLPDAQSANPIFRSFQCTGATVDWRLAEYEATQMLKRSVFPFRCLVGANAAFTRAAFDEAGGFCEDFTAWGGEDAEFGFRLYNHGVCRQSMKDQLA